MYTPFCVRDRAALLTMRFSAIRVIIFLISPVLLQSFMVGAVDVPFNRFISILRGKHREHPLPV